MESAFADMADVDRTSAIMKEETERIIDHSLPEFKCSFGIFPPAKGESVTAAHWHVVATEA